ncbi:hypothetical protein GCM10027200_53370 [Lentzea nigeriaca]
MSVVDLTRIGFLPLSSTFPTLGISEFRGQWAAVPAGPGQVPSPAGHLADPRGTPPAAQWSVAGREGSTWLKNGVLPATVLIRSR